MLCRSLIFKSTKACPRLCRYQSSKPSTPEDENQLPHDLSLIHEPGPGLSSHLPQDRNLQKSPASSGSSTAPAPLDLDATGIGHLLKKDRRPYVPRTQHQRLSYEYPGLPNQDEFSEASKQIKTVSRWSRYMPKVLVGVALLWGAYTVKVWFFPSEEEASSQDLLTVHKFQPFVITHKEAIDQDHYLIEIAPKFSHWQYSYASDYPRKLIWNGDRIWLVEVKQPDIMVTRSYTPLPLYFQKSEYTRLGERAPLLRVVENDKGDYDKNGVMTLYIKRYNDGEVSRFITNKDVGDEIEIRGPYTDYKFPFHPLNPLYERPIFRDLPSKVEPENLRESVVRDNALPAYDNVNFFAAGTGIASALQPLLSRNPYRGFMTIYYSAKSDLELGPLNRFLFFLNKLDRVNVMSFYDNERRLAAHDIPLAAPSNYLSPQRLEQALAQSPQDELRARLQAMDESDPEPVNGTSERPTGRLPHYQTALEQAAVTSQIPKQDASLALVCGPDGYVDHIAGSKRRDIDEQGDVGGALGKKGWTEHNVHKF